MSEQQPKEGQDSSLIDDAVAQGGAYEVIRKRLISQGCLLYTSDAADES